MALWLIDVLDLAHSRAIGLVVTRVSALAFATSGAAATGWRTGRIACHLR